MADTKIFEQLDYPKVLYKDGDTKTVQNADDEKAWTKAGWKLTPELPKTADVAKATEPK